MPVVGSMNIDRIDFYLDRKLSPFQSSQPLLCILDLSNTRVSVLLLNLTKIAVGCSALFGSILNIPRRLNPSFFVLSSQAQQGHISLVVRRAGSVEALLSCLRRQQAISLSPSVFPAAPANPYPSLGLTPGHHRRPLEYWKQFPSGGELVTGLCSCHTRQMSSLD